MTPHITPPKKVPKYLEDITYSIAEDPVRKTDDLFSSNRFLGLYDEKQIMDMLTKSGMVKILYERGYRDLVISLSQQDNYTYRLYVDFASQEEENTRLIELIVREGIFRPKKTFVSGFDFDEGLSMLLIEWLALQDPRSPFSDERPRLPGQAYPGLGGLKNMQSLLYDFGKASGKDAIIDIPEYYHAAVIYTRLYSEIYSLAYSFFSPIDSGQLQAMIRDFKGVPLADVSFAVTFDCLCNAHTGEPAYWKPSEEIYPISRKLHRYFNLKQYKDIVIETMNGLSFSMDWDKYQRLRVKGITDEV
jgi:hypothetical protein